MTRSYNICLLNVCTMSVCLSEYCANILLVFPVSGLKVSVRFYFLFNDHNVLPILRSHKKNIDSLRLRLFV